MKKNTAPRKNIIQPSDHWLAFIAAADAAGQSLSEWVGDACLEKLPENVRTQLSTRRRVGKPAKTILEKS